MLDRRHLLASVGGALVVPAVSTLSPAAPARAQSVASLPVSFRSAGASMSGDIYLPPAEPVAALVLVHGSGRNASMGQLGSRLAESGFAVLAYDKRGLGRSGGVYEETNNTSPENLRLLAGDAGAAMRVLRGHPRTGKLKAGYWGVSQAGWVVPLAMAQFAAADFFVLWSGPVCTVAEEMEAGIGTGGNLSDDATARKLVATLRSEGRDTDPRQSLRGIKVPGLWIYGGRDETLPVPLSIQRLQGLIDAGQPNFSYWLDSNARHADFQNSRPFMQAMVHWMKDRATSA